MADPNEQQEKEHVSIADLVKCAVLAWSATLLTISYLGLFPQMKMDNTFVASLLTGAMGSFGLNVRSNNANGNSNTPKKEPSRIEAKPPTK